MEIASLKSKKEWDSFLEKEEGVFTQSIKWGEFKKNYQKVERLEAKENGKLLGICQYFEEDTPLGKYLYIPFGPVSRDEEVREKLILKVKEIASKTGKMFVRIEPLSELKLGRKAPERIQPQKTLISQIEGKPEDILNTFKKGTRYNVRHAKRQGVNIRIENDLTPFINLLEKTEKRQGFKSYPKDYFEKLLDILECDFVVARKEEKVIAASILVYFGKTVTFIHSASDHETKNLNATSLIVFESMRLAKNNNYFFYDFWGIDEKKFPGVTKFKKGFGGDELIYPEGRDIPLKKFRYIIYFLLCKILKR